MFLLCPITLSLHAFEFKFPLLLKLTPVLTNNNVENIRAAALRKNYPFTTSRVLFEKLSEFKTVIIVLRKDKIKNR